MVLHRLLCLIVVVIFGPLAALAEGEQCYRKEDCECIFGSGGLRDGRWYAEASAGDFSSGTNSVVMHADVNYVDIVDHCDGKMDMTWQDEESGKIDWKLVRVSDGKSMASIDPSLSLGIDKSLLDEFYEADPAIAELARDNVMYMGSATYTNGEMTFLGTMLMVYSGLPGREDERGYAAMTIRFDFPGRPFWATTGRVDFTFSDETDDIYQRRREICRCDAAESDLASDIISIRIQERLMNEMKGREKRRVGYDQGVLAASGQKDLPAIMNDRFDKDKPWVMPSEGDPGNWPCLSYDQLDHTQKVADQDSFAKELLAEWDRYRHEDEQIDLRIAGKPTTPYVDPQSAADIKATTSVGGWVDRDSCREKVIGTDGKEYFADDPKFKAKHVRDPCKQNDLRHLSIRAHEAFHRKSCRSRAKDTTDMLNTLSDLSNKRTKMEGMDPQQAEKLYKEDLAECVGYSAYVTNSYFAAKEELAAYRAGHKVLADWVESYCKP